MTPEEIAALQESIAKLEANNARLTSELKTARKSIEITPDQLAQVEAERDKLQGDLSAAQKVGKESVKTLEALQTQLKTETGFTQKLLIDNGLTDELVKNGVAPQFLAATKAMFAGQAQIVADGDTRVAKIGDKSVSDFVKEWAGSDEGKHFVKAPDNSGGGSQGGNGSGKAANTLTNTAFQQLKPAEVAAFYAAKGRVVDD
jgi:hypothetical protein